MLRGEVWFAATPGGDRPVLVMTRDPVADRIERVVVAEVTSTRRGLSSELELGPEHGLPRHCCANFDNLYLLARTDFRRRVTSLDAATMAIACDRLNRALGC